MASVVTQNILSLGAPVVNSMNKKAYKTMFTLNSVNMNANNSIYANTLNTSEQIYAILESIDNKLLNLIGKLNDRVYFESETQLLSDIDFNKNNGEPSNKNTFWDDLQKINSVLSFANGTWNLSSAVKKVFDKFLNQNSSSAQTTQTIDLDSIPGKIICMCNCNCGGGVSSRQGGNSMTDVLDGVKTTAKATWNLLKTGTTVVGLLKAGTKVAGLLKSGTTTAGLLTAGSASTTTGAAAIATSTTEVAAVGTATTAVGGTATAGTSTAAGVGAAAAGTSALTIIGTVLVVVTAIAAMVGAMYLAYKQMQERNALSEAAFNPDAHVPSQPLSYDDMPFKDYITTELNAIDPVFKERALAATG